MKPQTHLRSVRANHRLLLLKRPSNKPHTILIPPGILADIQPHRVPSLARIRASLEADILPRLVAEDQVGVVVDGEASALRVPAWALDTRRVLDDALAHA